MASAEFRNDVRDALQTRVEQRLEHLAQFPRGCDGVHSLRNPVFFRADEVRAQLELHPKKLPAVSAALRWLARERFGVVQQGRDGRYEYTTRNELARAEQAGLELDDADALKGTTLPALRGKVGARAVALQIAIQARIDSLSPSALDRLHDDLTAIWERLNGLEKEA